MKEQEILLQIEQLPDDLKREVLDFIGFLLMKYQLTHSPTKPEREKKFGKYRGSLKSGLSIDEIDAQLDQLRSEWERPIA
ncbi:MAG: DUF2281 domain-containing protein [Phaeodactylibacter sp.]|nr:DUF2281 domain-containing protein [Phaeodactylibacter sp.]